MTNEVDTSTETINLEFDAASDAIGIVPEQPVITAQENQAMLDAERESQIAIAQQMMNTTLRLTLGAMINVTLDNQHTEEASRAYAVLIVKYFPGGLFGLLDRYKEELGAVTATVMLINVVSQAKAKQQKEQQTEAEKAALAKKPVASATGCFTFNESANETQGDSLNG